MKKDQIIFFEEMGFGWVINDTIVRELGLINFRGQRLSETPMDQIAKNNGLPRMFH